MALLNHIESLTSRHKLFARPSDIPPGPLLFAIHKARGERRLRYLLSLRERYGDAVRMKLANRTIYMISDPALVGTLLQDRSGVFEKGIGLSQVLHELLGDGLLTSQGEVWRRQRKLAAPALRRKQLADYAQTMVDCAEHHVASLPERSVRELDDDMMTLTLRIVLKVLFSVELEVEVIGEALDDVMAYFNQRMLSPWRFWPMGAPIPMQGRYRRAIATLDGVVYGLIASRREMAPDARPDDLLSRWLDARDDEGAAMSDRQVRDEALTMILAGHETTALTITYALRLLSEQPETLAALRAELDDALEGRAPSFDDLGSLPFTRAVVQESLRLYPPAWVVARSPSKETMLGPWRVPAGAQVFFSPWIMHRDPNVFEDPESFRPQRWLDGLERSLPRGAYIPFSDGPRVCIGNHFAMMEATLLVATLVSRLDFASPPDAGPLRLSPSITLRPAAPIPMQITRRVADR